MFFHDLETERLYLKNISPNDRQFIYNHFSNDDVNMYLFDSEPLTDIEGADDIISLFTIPEPKQQHRWILIKKDDNEKIGTCGFHIWDTISKNCDVGYDLNSTYWGKGYMREAIKAIILFAKNEMKIEHINACIYPDNLRSISLAEKCGFVFKGQTKDEIFRGVKYNHNILTLDLI